VGTPSSRVPERPAPAPSPAPPSRPDWRHQFVDRVRRRRRLLIVLASLLVLYTVFGFLILPLIVRRQLEKRLTAALHRETTVARVRTNPYALSVTIDGLLVKAADGSPFLSWDRLYVNLGAWRIIRREVSLDEIYLLRFHARVALDRKGNLNFQDLLDESSSSEPGPSSAPEQKKRPLVFAVQKLGIEQAQIDFSDRSRRRPFDSTVGPFDINLQGFRTLPDSTSPYSFAGRTEAGETFSWAGSLLTEPLRSIGTISFEGLRLSKYSPYYEQEVGFDIRDGLLGLKTAYTLEWGTENHLLRLADGAISVRTLVLGIPGNPQPKVELPVADVGGIGIDVVGRTARVESVLLKDAVIRSRRNSNGRFDLEQMKPPRKAGPPPKEKNEPWHWSLGKIELAGWRVEFQDDQPARPVRLTLAPLNVRLADLSDKAQQASQLFASVGFGGKGTVKVEGPLKLLRPALDLALSVESLDLSQFDPYLDLYGDLAARLGSGTLGLQGHARFDGGAEPAKWSFEGDTRVDGLTLLDSERNQELVRWKDLQISSIKTASDPLAVSIRSVRWVQPRFRVALAEDGSSNLRRLLKAPPPRPGKGEEKPAEEKQADSAKPAEDGKAAENKPTETSVKAPRQKPQPPVSLAIFQIVRGAATFTDRSVNPPVTLSVTDLDVRLRGLSNALNARSQVQVKGLVSGGPLEINGILSPRMVNDATDVKVSSKGIDLTPLSPYCGKYAGYGLDKGKLDLALEYKVAKRKLAASNSVKIDQFTFGEATNSPDATKLPVKLGLAVLQDPNGLIDLDVPVEGNVDDPNFRLGRVIWRAIGNVLLKAVTSPFNLLAKLVGGGGAEKLDVVDFQAGAADLTPSADKSLQGLSKALASRPALKVDVEGTADPAADGKTLRLKELKRQAAAARAEKGQKGEMTDEEYVKFVEKRWRSLAPQNQSGTPPDPAAMEDAVLASVQLPPESLGALRQGRAEAARARLQALGVDPGRLFLTQGGERAKKEGGTRVYFTLK
jgi:uncharacterized protein DUF748